MWWVFYLKANFQQRNNGVMQIILINVVLFLMFLGIKIIGFIIGNEGIYQLLTQQLYLPAMWSLFKCKPWTLFTYCFVQENLFPMLWSLFSLYLFGNIIRNYLGSKHFVILYLLGGLVGGVSFLLLYNYSPIFQGVSTNLMGASPSVYAIMVGAAMIVPNFDVRLLLLGGVRMKYIVSFLIIVSLLSLTTETAGNGVAQLGGALVGYLYSKQMKGGQKGLFTWFRDLFHQDNGLKIVRHQPRKPRDKF